MRFIAGAFAFFAVAFVPVVATAQQQQAAVNQTKQIPEAKQSWPQEAALKGDYPRGAIIVNVTERRLYYSLGDGKALMYRVAVGKTGFGWTGQSWVSMKTKNPAWYPTARMQAAGAPRYVAPGPNNPLGARALYLGWSEYRIHGTNAPHSIGSASSSGCFRMINEDVTDLFERVAIGAPVYVVQ
ncbi:MAG: L,D-transpeptidase [Xanthobacteraceae bacterium]|nr:L,D-transpeptidase [Xanthobacteraceae bacterium]MBX3549766.1 L,D-transpeptidase [Xanthobacteraceae bacterium]MCW5679605.1 L,D-transpeptidase [Xanthobacteraceae bacterium]